PITTTDPGAPYPHHTLAPVLPRTGTFPITLTTAYTGTYRIGTSGPLHPITGTVTTTTSLDPRTGLEARTRPAAHTLPASPPRPPRRRPAPPSPPPPPTAAPAPPPPHAPPPPRPPPPPPPAGHTPVPGGVVPADLWEERYSGARQVWSGRPNQLLTQVAADLT